MIFGGLFQIGMCLNLAHDSKAGRYQRQRGRGRMQGRQKLYSQLLSQREPEHKGSTKKILPFCLLFFPNSYMRTHCYRKPSQLSILESGLINRQSREKQGKLFDKVQTGATTFWWIGGELQKTVERTKDSLLPTTSNHAALVTEEINLTKVASVRLPY